MEKKGTPKNPEKKGTSKNIENKGTPKNVSKKDTPRNLEKSRKTEGNMQRNPEINKKANEIIKNFSETNKNFEDKSVPIQSMDILENNSQADSFLNFDNCLEEANFSQNQDKSVKNELGKNIQVHGEDHIVSSVKNINIHQSKNNDQKSVKNEKAYLSDNRAKNALTKNEKIIDDINLQIKNPTNKLFNGQSNTKLEQNRKVEESNEQRKPMPLTKTQNSNTEKNKLLSTSKFENRFMPNTSNKIDFVIKKTSFNNRTPQVKLNENQETLNSSNKKPFMKSSMTYKSKPLLSINTNNSSLRNDEKYFLKRDMSGDQSVKVEFQTFKGDLSGDQSVKVNIFNGDMSGDQSVKVEFQTFKGDLSGDQSVKVGFKNINSINTSIQTSTKSTKNIYSRTIGNTLHTKKNIEKSPNLSNNTLTLTNSNSQYIKEQPKRQMRYEFATFKNNLKNINEVVENAMEPYNVNW